MSDDHGLEKYYTTEEAAAYLGVSTYTMKNWRILGFGPKFTRVSRQKIRYREAELNQWMRAREFQSTSEERAGSGESKA